MIWGMTPILRNTQVATRIQRLLRMTWDIMQPMGKPPLVAASCGTASLHIKLVTPRGMITNLCTGSSSSWARCMVKQLQNKVLRWAFAYRVIGSFPSRYRFSETQMHFSSLQSSTIVTSGSISCLMGDFWGNTMSQYNQCPAGSANIQGHVAQYTPPLKGKAEPRTFSDETTLLSMMRQPLWVRCIIHTVESIINHHYSSVAIITHYSSIIHQCSYPESARVPIFCSSIIFYQVSPRFHPAWSAMKHQGFTGVSPAIHPAIHHVEPPAIRSRTDALRYHSEPASDPGFRRGQGLRHHLQRSWARAAREKPWVHWGLRVVSGS